METSGLTSRYGQDSSEKSYDDKKRSDSTGGCKSNPTRSAPRPDMCPAGNTMMMMIMMMMFKMSALLSPHSGNSTLYNLLDP